MEVVVCQPSSGRLDSERTHTVPPMVIDSPNPPPYLQGGVWLPGIIGARRVVSNPAS